MTPVSRTLGCIVILGLLGGCVGGLSSENSGLRGSIKTQPPSSPIVMSYKHGAMCTYADSHHYEGAQSVATRVSVSMTQIPGTNQFQLGFTGRDHIFTGSDQTPGSALIDSSGHLSHFNLSGKSSGMRYSPDTQQDLDQAVVAKSIARDPNPDNHHHSINPIAMFAPEYLRQELRIGEAAAIVIDEVYRPWSTYFFSGVTTYKGIPAAVFDLRHDSFILVGEVPVTIGFIVVDLRNGLPLLMVLDAGSHIKIEQIGCSG